MCDRPGVERPDHAFDLGRGARPVDRRLRLREPGGEGGAGLVLRPGLHRAGLQGVQGIDERRRAELGEAAGQGAGGVPGGDGAGPRCEDRSGVEARVHPHDRDPGLPVAGEDRMMHRGRAAPAREDRCVDVDAAEPGDGEDRSRQQKAVGRDDQRVEAERGQRARRLGGAHRAGLEDLDAGAGGTPLDGAFRDAATAPRARVGPGEHRLDRMAGARQGIEDDGRELRGAGECELHSGGLTFAAKPSPPSFGCVAA